MGMLAITDRGTDASSLSVHRPTRPSSRSTAPAETPVAPLVSPVPPLPPSPSSSPVSFQGKQEGNGNGKRKAIRNHVESPRGWRALAKGEQDAGLEADTRVQVSLYRCDLCWIHIGPGHYENSLYLYPVQKQTLSPGDGPPQYMVSSWLRICGGCAHHRSRELPEYLCLMAAEDWQTTRLLVWAQAERAGHPNVSLVPEATNLSNYTQMKQIRAAVQAQVKQRLTAFFLLFCVSRGIALSHFSRSSVPFSSPLSSHSPSLPLPLPLPLPSSQRRTDECPATPSSTFLQHARPASLLSFLSSHHTSQRQGQEHRQEVATA